MKFNKKSIYGSIVISSLLLVGCGDDSSIISEKHKEQELLEDESIDILYSVEDINNYMMGEPRENMTSYISMFSDIANDENKITVLLENADTYISNFNFFYGEFEKCYQYGEDEKSKQLSLLAMDMCKNLKLSVENLKNGYISVEYLETAINYARVATDKLKEYSELYTGRVNDEGSNDTHDRTESKISKDILESSTYNNIREGDVLIGLELSDENIVIDIDLEKHEIISDKDLAITTYSSISDELLNYGGWSKLTIRFKDIGEITMRYDDSKNDGNGRYFDVASFENQIIG